jgi:hypothetical protein
MVGAWRHGNAVPAMLRTIEIAYPLCAFFPANYNIKNSHKHSIQNRLMKLRISLALLLCLAIGLSAQSSRSNKRGVSENNFTYTEDVKALSAGCSWMYNWGVAP